MWVCVCACTQVHTHHLPPPSFYNGHISFPSLPKHQAMGYRMLGIKDLGISLPWNRDWLLCQHPRNLAYTSGLYLSFPWTRGSWEETGKWLLDWKATRAAILLSSFQPILNCMYFPNHSTLFRVFLLLMLLCLECSFFPSFSSWCLPILLD